jgi:hypothetical protein
MANTYFNFHGNNTNEQTLYKNIQDEICEMYGFNGYYLPRKFSTAKDLVFGEDPLSYFNQYFTLTLYLENVTQFDGQNDLFSKFGLKVDDHISLLIAQTRFKTITSLANPFANDLIFFPFNNALFEIYNVEMEKASFFWTGTTGLYRLQARHYEWSGEKFTTGQVDLDKFDNYTTTSKSDENSVISNEAANYIDSTETNPFGNP